jgi:hypothetical protein
MGRLGFGPLGMQVAILYAYIWSYMYSCKAAVLSAPGPFGSSHELTSEEVGGGAAFISNAYSPILYTQEKKGQHMSRKFKENISALPAHERDRLQSLRLMGAFFERGMRLN